jgi:hypothetical protein
MLSNFVKMYVVMQVRQKLGISEDRAFPKPIALDLETSLINSHLITTNSRKQQWVLELRLL